jgi:2-methylisocitrate lyase-like PEP mutase family enzyme
VSKSLNARFRSRVFDGGAPLLLPGASDAMVARLLEDVGAEAIYISGAGTTNALLGMPDLGVLTATELIAQVSAIRDVVELPLVVDADTGFGNVVNVRRTVRALERAGASAIQIEDQVMPKRCGHFPDKSVISAREKLGLSEALDRMQAYREAGADVLFVEAPESVDEMKKAVAAIPGPHIVNMVEGGLTPILPMAELAEIGFAIVLYANSVMRAGMMGMRSVAQHLVKTGDTLAVDDQIAGWEFRQSLVRKQFFDELVDTYQSRAARGGAIAAATDTGAGVP